jgi:PleD family two-component response regulator
MESLLLAADGALYEAKLKGRNRCSLGQHDAPRTSPMAQAR